MPHQLAQQALSIPPVLVGAALPGREGRDLEVRCQAAHMLGRILGRHTQRHVCQAQRVHGLHAQRCSLIAQLNSRAAAGSCCQRPICTHFALPVYLVLAGAMRMLCMSVYQTR